MPEKLEFVELTSDDSDIALLKEYYNIDSVKKYIGISDNYFEYVTATPNVKYFKILLQQKIIGGLHIEINKTIMSLSIWIHPDYQHCGYGEKVICTIINGCKDSNLAKIEVGIDINNTSSIKLFEKVNFIFKDTDGEINNYEYKIK